MRSQMKQAESGQVEQRTMPKEKTGNESSGLDECREMDRDLARVALANLDHVHVSLLVEIFQCVDFMRLLNFRRVCKNWDKEISRESAPFCRQVAIALGSFRPDNPTSYRWTYRCYHEYNYMHDFWKFAKSATTILCFEKVKKKNHFPDDYRNPGCKTKIRDMWKSYEKQCHVDGRTRFIDKVIYAKAIIGVTAFHYPPAVYRSGTRTVLYQCELELPLEKLIGFIPPHNGYKESWAVQRYGIPVPLQVSGLKSHVLSEKEATWTKFGQGIDDDLDRGCVNPIAVHFALASDCALSESQWIDVKQLADRIGKGKVGFLTGDPEDLKRLVDQFDPGNQAALDCYPNTDDWDYDYYDTFDIRSLANKAHPVVTTVMLTAINFGESDGLPGF